ncbi:MAG: hypothetical protein IIC26_04020, partial [Chloroflexi bacterium]|nr:hypothetical protein [Chloroflexota bacterium]
MAKRTIVGSPLAPAMLERLGAIGEFPTTGADFSPDGSWTNTYRIWTCHGYREEGNEEEGHLRIKRAAGGSRGAAMLVVDQHIVNEEAVSNIIHAEIRCNGDEIAS